MFRNNHNVYPIKSRREPGKYPFASIVVSTRIFDLNAKGQEWVRIDLYHEDEPYNEMCETYGIVTQEDSTREILEEGGPAKICLDGIGAYLGAFLEARAEMNAKTRTAE